MYSWEIDKFIKDRNYKLSSIEYCNLCDTSHQINRIKYNQIFNNYEIWTDDNYYFKFKVYYQK